ncbi:single-stranded-DNA-specific exonuclease RecJ [Patescibacteria group bacterium]|nr:single-stranded-DNA-specific exonuclease RecJ [Patescibacteria group bacterium]MDE2010648.1 single-stranded-DNA-specific exonuclease RecJ [Patescibacteria group bacterium]MDE2233320.1 single-stranded-DNA-specific exonuclease RecJ [Patescibacteria group bacterium]
MKYSIRRQLSNEELTKLATFPPLVAHLLFHRGISDGNAAEKFMVPDYERDTHDPLLLQDAGKAAARIIQAIKNDEKTVIYADYDADGIPGAVIFDQLFKKIGFKNYFVYIPHRHDEGFGLNEDAVLEFAEQGVKLAITIDCGITDKTALELAFGKGIDIIVTDHHEQPEAGLPPAYAVVDPKRNDCAYPDKNICGAGVAYKLIQAVLGVDSFGIKKGWEKWLLDMVGVATLSDMVPLTGENRVFSHYGLQVLRKSPRKGLNELLGKLRISKKHLTEDDIGFMITPRINAASRMGVPMDAFNLLSAENDILAAKYAERLDAVNNERKAAVAVLVKEVKRTIRERYGENITAVIVLGNPVWRPSLLGLAANTCAAEFNRPVFLWGRDGGNIIKGSCRSEGRTNVVELMRAVPGGVFSQFGGHKHSGGFAVSNDQVYFLEKHLNEADEKTKNQKPKIKNSEQESGLGEEDFIDAELALGAVDWELYEDISKLAPFGKDNPKPVFLFRNVMPAEVRRFGKGKEHIGVDFKRLNGSRLSAISFFGAENEWAGEIKTGKPIDMIASLEKSIFRGKIELRLRIFDIISL